MSSVSQLAQAHQAAKNKASAFGAQASALKNQASELDNAIEDLQDSMRDEIRELEARLEEMRKTDEAYAAKLRERIAELEYHIQMLDDLRETINDTFPMSNTSQAAETLAMVAGLATIVGNSAANISPSIQAAAERLRDVSQEVVDTSKTILPCLAGHPIFCAAGLDPINLTTGNFVYDKADITVPGRYPLTFTRTYNAMGSFEGILGHGWTHNYNIRLFKAISEAAMKAESEATIKAKTDETASNETKSNETKNNGDTSNETNNSETTPIPQTETTIHIVFEDGHVETYGRISHDLYAAPPEHKNTLLNATEAPYTYDLIQPNGIRYRFGEAGALLCIDDPNGNKTILDYDDHSILLKKVSTQSGSLIFEYNDDGRLTKVSDHTGREV